VLCGSLGICCEQLPVDLWIHFLNGYFEVDLFLIKGIMFFFTYNHRTSLTGDVFISYEC